jgi:hypothetical protein
MSREITLSDIGNDVHNKKGYYWRLSEYLEKFELLDDDDTNELCCRIEAFIDQEIEEIRLENPEKYDEEHVDYRYPF